MTDIAIYARYSSDLQNAASTDDQIRLCREHADCEGWRVAECYTDEAVSGASIMRPGIQALLEDMRRGKFAMILAESVDRLFARSGRYRAYLQGRALCRLRHRHPVRRQDQ